MKKLFVIILALFVGFAYAANETVVTSKKFVDAALAQKQPKFDGLGNDKLMLYSNTTDGVVASRDIVTTLGSSTSDTSVPTVGAINAGLNTKQDTLNGDAGWVAENTGIAGAVVQKPVYSATNNYSNALVEVETLNNAVINAVNSELTVVPGVGWTINTANNLNLLPVPKTYNPYLPDGYTQLEYIESTGTQWIDTGIKGHMNYTYELDFQQTDNAQYRNWGVFNQSDFVGQNMSLTWGGNSGSVTGLVVRWETAADQQAVVGVGPRDTNRHILRIVDGRVYFDGLNKGKSGGHDSSFIFNYNLFLGTINPGGTTPRHNAKSKYYSYKVWNANGELIQNFVPAKNSSNVVGMYDTVSGTFFTNAGTGTFTAGPDVHF